MMPFDLWCGGGKRTKGGTENVAGIIGMGAAVEGFYEKYECPLQ